MIRWSLEPLLNLLARFGLVVDQAGLGLNYAQFNVNYTDGQAEGRVQWNAEDGTLEYGLPGGTVNLQIGQEHVVRCRNEGDPIANGKIVYVAGESGNRPLISLADADTTNSQPESVVLGMTTETIGNNSTGYVTLMGLVRDVDTDGVSPGTMVWLSETTPGAFRSTPPTAPNRHIAVGQVITEGVENGSIYIRVLVIPPLILLADVLTSAPNDGDILVWVAANGRFELQQPS
jgi:hypothetical protein